VRKGAGKDWEIRPFFRCLGVCLGKSKDGLCSAPWLHSSHHDQNRHVKVGGAPGIFFEIQIETESNWEKKRAPTHTCDHFCAWQKPITHGKTPGHGPMRMHWKGRANGSLAIVAKKKNGEDGAGPKGKHSKEGKEEKKDSEQASPKWRMMAGLQTAELKCGHAQEGS